MCHYECKCSQWNQCKVQFLCSQHITGAAAFISIPLNTPQPLFQVHNYFQHSASVSKVELFHLLFIFLWPVTVNVAYCSRECVCVHVCVHTGCVCGAGDSTEIQNSAICSHIINLIVIPKSTVASASRGPDDFVTLVCDVCAC